MATSEKNRVVFERPFGELTLQNEAVAAPKSHGMIRRVSTVSTQWLRAEHRWWHLSTHLALCLVWLSAGITLLILNFQQHIVGASIGCSSCRINPFSGSTYSEEAGFNRRDHTALSGLQFASKALEIWFAIVMAGLLYDLLAILTTKSDGLPVSLFGKYLQFSDILTLFDYPKGWLHPLHRMFIISVAVLCVIMNLMGPTTAILILPNLQWVDTDISKEGLFGGMESSTPPQNSAIAPNCTSELLAVGTFSCTAQPYSYILDELFASVVASLDQIGASPILFDPVISQEGQVSFVVNTTDLYVDWIPSRQVAREISDDYLAYANGVNGQHSNKLGLYDSLSTILVRDGPVMGLGGGCYRGNLSVADVGDGQSIRCYGAWNLFADGDSEYTKCIRAGGGWNGTNTQSNLFLGDETSPSDDLAITAYFVDVAIIPDIADPQCFSEDGSPQSNSTCDWDSIFFTVTIPDNLWNTSKNFILVEYHVPGLSTSDNTIWCDDISYSSLQSYTLDPSPYSNFIHVVQLENADPQVQTHTLPLVVHSDWILAAWSVDQNGTVDGSRIAAAQMVSIVKAALSDTGDADTLDLSTLNYLDGVVTDQALSLIDFGIIPITNKTTLEAYPILKSSVQIEVWTYGLQSTTSKLSATVVILGCLLVTIRMAVALERAKSGKYASPKSLKELLVAALEHDPQSHPHPAMPVPTKTGDEKMRFRVDGNEISFMRTH